jgi:hypothetical protein
MRPSVVSTATRATLMALQMLSALRGVKRIYRH